MAAVKVHYNKFDDLVRDFLEPADLETEKERRDWQIVVDGRAVHRRRVSRRLVFIDLLEQGDVRSDVRISLIIKDVEGDAAELVRMARSVVHLGDVVSATCTLDPSSSASNVLLLCTQLSVVPGGAWSSPHPFIPLPPPGQGVGRVPLSALRHEFAAVQAASIAEDDEENEDEPTLAPHCKYWLNTGRCPRVECPYRHVEGAQRGGLRSAFVDGRMQRRAMEGRQAGDTLDPSEHVSRHQRAERFVEWLVSTMELQKGQPAGVLDVAGGRGDVSFHLALLGIKSTLIDPRPRNMHPQQESRLAEAGATAPPQLCILFDDAMIAADEHATLLANTCLVVGMHPDQATEPIVDFCLARGKAFAILPCCVFPKLFPDRKLADGTPVVTYSQFVDYLQAKHPGIQRTFLPFRGRNLVLYWNPKMSEKV